MVDGVSKAPEKLRKVQVVFRRDPSDVKNVLVSAGFELVDDDPDFVVCYGGDALINIL